MANEVEISVIAVDSASNILRNIGNEFGVLGQVGIAALTAIGGAFEMLITSGAKYEDTLTRFDALLATSPMKDYRQSILDSAEAMAQLTRFQDDDIIAADTVLLRFHELGKDVFPQATEAALNMAALMGTDATTAARQLGMALEDPAARMGALTRAGIGFSAQQKEQIKDMEKSGNLLGAQKLLLQAINDVTGDLAKTMGSNVVGQWARFNNEIKDFADVHGKKFLDALSPMMDDLMQLAEKLLPEIGNWLDTKILPAFEKFVNLLSKGDFKGIWSSFINGLKNTDWRGVSQALAQGMNSINWSDVGTSFASGSRDLGEVFIVMIRNIDWNAVGDAFANAFTGVVRDGIGKSIVQAWIPAAQQFWILMANINAIVGQGLNDILSTIEGWGSSIYGSLSKLAGNFYSSAINWVSNMISGMMTAIGRIISTLAVWIGVIDSNTRSIPGMFYSLGAQCMGQFAQAMTAEIGRAVAAVQNAIQQIKNAVGGGITIPILLAITQSFNALVNIQTIGGGGGGGRVSNEGAYAGAVRGGGGIVKRQHGGLIDEPVIGIGTKTGRQWSFGEDGNPEMVVPYGGGSSGRGTGMNFTFVYSPAISLGTRNEIETVLAPYIYKMIRNARGANI